jgi:O-antigen ligase/tetratricopeptide (TPR) repeat protein
MAKDPSVERGFRPRMVRRLRAVMEAVVLLMVCLSPWAFGAAGPQFEFYLDVGVAVLMALWGMAIVLEGQLTWRKCPLALCLAGLVLLGVWQVLPLPGPVLSTVSPETARTYQRLLPARHEVLAADSGSRPSADHPGTTVSFYPGATTRELTRLLAVFLLFAAVRNNCASAAALRRLSVVATANGALLSLVALLQAFSSSRHLVYWTFPSAGEVFGPFICRNHFPFYVNVCLGLAAGLLLSWRNSGAERDGWAGRAHGLLHEPRLLWVGAAVVLMLAAVALSLSRGGLLALVGAAVVCLLLHAAHTRRLSQLGAAALVGALALGLLTWFGLDRVKARLATVWEGAALKDDRVPLWTRLLPTAADFPLLGTGYGTFDYVELMTRDSGADIGYLYEHAHNDYLEALLEGGGVRLALSLLAIGVVFRLGSRGLGRSDPSGVSGLVLGALLGFTAVVLQSFVDFGLHIPAIAVLATVLCAQLAAVGSATPEDQREGTPGPVPGAYVLRLGGLAPAAGLLTALALGAAVLAEGWRAARVDRYRQTATRLRQARDPDQRALAVTYLEAAAALAPESALVQAQLGEVRLQLLAEGHARQVRAAQLADAATVLPSLAPAGPSSALTAFPAWTAAARARQLHFRRREQALAGKYLAPALRAYLRARDLCPLLADPHLRIALHLPHFERAEPRAAYLERVKTLAPDDPEAWYLCGVQEIFDGQPGQAWRSWRHSLELSDRYRATIVAAVARNPKAGEVFPRVLPDRPALWLAAAEQLFPQPGAPERKPFYRRALLLLEQRAGRLTPQELHLQGTLYVRLGRPADAVSAYRAALEQLPEEVGWRLDLARVLYRLGRLPEARRELLSVLGQEPGHAEARELLREVERELAKKG